MNHSLLLFHGTCDFFFKVANDVGRVSEYFQELLNCLEREKKIGAYDCWGNGFYTHRVKLSLCLESWECANKDVMCKQSGLTDASHEKSYWYWTVFFSYAFIHLAQDLRVYVLFFVPENIFLSLISYYQESHFEEKIKPSHYSFFNLLNQMTTFFFFFNRLGYKPISHFTFG